MFNDSKLDLDLKFDADSAVAHHQDERLRAVIKMIDGVERSIITEKRVITFYF